MDSEVSYLGETTTIEITEKLEILHSSNIRACAKNSDTQLRFVVLLILKNPTVLSQRGNIQKHSYSISIPIKSA